MTKTAKSESQVMTGLWEQLPIPTEATTSRVVLNNELLRIVEFAMDAGQERTDHASDRAVAVLALSGDLTFSVAGEPRTLTPGDVVYLAPGERHAVVAQSPCRFTLVLMHPGSGQ